MSEPTEGATIQRDGMTYAVMTRIPVGIVTPDDLEKIAKAGTEVSRAYAQDYQRPADRAYRS